MKTYILVYEDFAQFEVILASYFLKTRGEVITVGLTDNVVTSSEGFKIVPDITIDEVVAKEVEVFLVPGGNPFNIFEYSKVYEILRELNAMNKTIGALCAGVIHLGKAGVLTNKSYATSIDLNDFKDLASQGYIDKNVVIDGNIITAKATGYVDFAIEIGKMHNIYENEEDLKETISFYKHFGS